jgi:hypothetical protein
VNQTGGSGGSGGGGGGESFAADLGEIIANEPYVLTHDLDTWDLVYSIIEKDSASPNGGVGEFVDAEVKSLSPNTVSITFTSPAVANKYRFIIGGGGSSSHSSLTDLTSDDHTQYLNNARGDARYSPIGHDHDSEYLQPANILAGNNVTVDLSTPGSAIISASGSQWPPDIPPTEPSPFDYEFEATGDTLPSGWQWLNQGTSTYREQYGAGYLTAPTGEGHNNRVMYRSISTDPSFEYRAKFRLVSVRNASFFQTGFFLTDGTRLAVAGYDNRGAKWILWNTPTSYNTESGGFPLMLGDTLYLSLRKNSATSWDIGYSTDGVVYSYYYTGVNFGAFLTPTGLGFGFQNENSVGLQTVACEWFRKVS